MKTKEEDYRLINPDWHPPEGNPWFTIGCGLIVVVVIAALIIFLTQQGGEIWIQILSQL